MASGEDALAVLRSIDNSLKTLVALAQSGKQTVASDRDLDSQYGNEVVRFDPRDWTGASFKGRHMSECPAEFLELLGDTYAYFGLKNEAAGALTDKGKPKAEFDRRSEGRARGWANRMRAGTHKAPAVAAAAGEEWANNGF